MSSLVVVLTDKADRANFPTPIIEDVTNRVFKLQFSTSLPGGFMDCTLSILLPKSRAYEWYERFLFFGINVYEADEPVWEGRISAIAIKDFGIELECEGYWTSLADQTLYSFWNDNNMNAWRIPVAGAGGISDEISLAGAGKSDKFNMSLGPDIFRISTKKNLVYDVGDVACFYYRLPRIGNINDRRLFQPMTIHRIEFELDSLINPTKMDDFVWTADHPKGTWDAGTDLIISSRLWSDNIGADGSDIEAVAIGTAVHTGFTETADDGEQRIVFKNVTVFAERDATNQRPTTGKKIITNLLSGNSDIDVTAKAKQISTDESFIEDTELEISPAIFEGDTLQDIITKVNSFGLSTIENLVSNPSVENDRNGWVAAGDVNGTVVQVADPQFGDKGAQIDVVSGAVAGSGLCILNNQEIVGLSFIAVRNWMRQVVKPSTKYTLSAYLRESGASDFDIRIDWYNDTGFNGTFISSSIVTVAASTSYNRESVTATSPATAVAAQIFIVLTGSPGSNVTFFVDAASLRQVRTGEADLVDYLDGTFDNVFWAGTPHIARTMEVQPATIGVYGRNRLHVKRRDDTSIKWLLSVKDIDEGGIDLQKSTQGFASRLWTRFSESFTGYTRFTDLVEAPLEQSLFYDERDSVIELGQSIEGFARLVAQVNLRDIRSPRQSSEIVISGTIANSLGVREPLWRVRSGDILYIHDLASMPTIQPVAISPRANMFLDKLRIFLIKETEFDAEKGKLRIIPDFPPNWLDLLLAKLVTSPSVSTTGSISAGGGSGGIVGLLPGGP